MRLRWYVRGGVRCLRQHVDCDAQRHGGIAHGWENEDMSETRASKNQGSRLLAHKPSAACRRVGPHRAYECEAIETPTTRPDEALREPPSRFQYLEPLAAQIARLSVEEVQALLVMCVAAGSINVVAVQNGRIYPSVSSIPDAEFDPLTVVMLFDV